MYQELDKNNVNFYHEEAEDNDEHGSPSEAHGVVEDARDDGTHCVAQTEGGCVKARHKPVGPKVVRKTRFTKEQACA